MRISSSGFTAFGASTRSLGISREVSPPSTRSWISSTNVSSHDLAGVPVQWAGTALASAGACGGAQAKPSARRRARLARPLDALTRARRAKHVDRRKGDRTEQCRYRGLPWRPIKSRSSTVPVAVGCANLSPWARRLRLDDDVAEAFEGDAAVNEALRRRHRARVPRHDDPKQGALTGGDGRSGALTVVQRTKARDCGTHASARSGLERTSPTAPAFMSAASLRDDWRGLGVAGGWGVRFGVDSDSDSEEADSDSDPATSSSASNSPAW